MAYMLGQFLGALVITGIIIGLATRWWKRSATVALVVAIVATLVLAWGSGELSPTYIVACALWALFWRWRLSKVKPATSEPKV